MTIESDARAEAERRFEYAGLSETKTDAFVAGYLAGAQRAALDMPAATRVEVIDPHEGRAFTAYYDAPGVIVRVQDEGRTVKVFTGGKRAASPAVTDEMVERAADELGVAIGGGDLSDLARVILEAALTAPRDGGES